MINSQHFIFDIAVLVLAIAIVIHTIAEAWIPAYQKVKPDWRGVVFNRTLFLENLPIFILTIGAAIVGWRWVIIGAILPAVGVTHPLLDHLWLSWKNQQLRPGSWTGLFLLPLSIGVYTLSYVYQILTVGELLISGAIGLAISVWLFWMITQELAKHPQ
jgi:Protein of unknown function with HXXEE motif